MAGVVTCLLVLCCIIIIPAQTAKILSVFSFPSPSHYIFASALLKELAKRGHEVTSMSPYPQKVALKNFRDINLFENVNIIDEYMEHVKSQKKKGVWEKKTYLSRITERMCYNIFENEQVKQLLNSTEEVFDLVIVETLFDESLYGLGQHFNAPMIGVSTFGTIGPIDDLVGNTSPVSYTPHLSLPLASEMSFTERMTNFFFQTVDVLHNHLDNLPRQRNLYNTYFPHASIDFEEARKSFSLVLLNQHHSLSYPRPYVPNMIDVGGLHLNKNFNHAMPHELQQYLDNATEGVIYFSMGSNLKSKDFSAEKLQMFVNVFSSLKQKVLWKFEDTNLQTASNNIYVSNWFPQPAVLAHPNVKVFMTHGGLLSITEAIFHAKPLLGLPMFADQRKNIAQCVARKIALSVNSFDLNENELRHALMEILYNPQYKDTMQQVSNHYHDQPMTPMDTAVYWIEYVLRHGGCEHLRNAGMKLNFFQYHSLDILGAFLCCSILCVLILYWSFMKLLKSFLTPVICIKNREELPNIKLKRG